MSKVTISSKGQTGGVTAGNVTVRPNTDLSDPQPVVTDRVVMDEDDGNVFIHTESQSSGFVVREAPGLCQEIRCD